MLAVRRMRADCDGRARLEGKAGQDELDEELDGMASGTTVQRADRLAGSDATKAGRRRNEVTAGRGARR